MWVPENWFSIVNETGMMAKPDSFQVGDRVQLVLHYSLEGDPPPEGTVVGIGRQLLTVRMDRHGRVIGFVPSDLRIVEKPR